MCRLLQCSMIPLVLASSSVFAADPISSIAGTYQGALPKDSHKVTITNGDSSRKGTIANSPQAKNWDTGTFTFKGGGPWNSDEKLEVNARRFEGHFHYTKGDKTWKVPFCSSYDGMYITSGGWFDQSEGELRHTKAERTLLTASRERMRPQPQQVRDIRSRLRTEPTPCSTEPRLATQIRRDANRRRSSGVVAALGLRIPENDHQNYNRFYGKFEYLSDKNVKTVVHFTVSFDGKYIILANGDILVRQN